MAEVRSRPIASIVIPTFHRPLQLRACLQALAYLACSDRADDWEIVVTDDGHDTVETMIAREFPWARWLPGPRRGPAANRNAGIASSSGDLILLTDDDCIPDGGWADALADAAAKHVDDAIFEGATYADRPQRSLADESPVNLTGGHYWTCNLAIRRTAFTLVGGFDESFPFAAFEDIDFALRLQEAGIKGRFVPEARVCHPWRTHPGWQSWQRMRASVRYFMHKHPMQDHFHRSRFWAGCAFWAGAKSIPELVRYRGRGAYVPLQRVAFNLLMLSDTLRASGRRLLDRAHAR